MSQNAIGRYRTDFARAFGFDSAEIRAESAGVLEELFRGLEYNQRLSERRAQAVVADLVRRGLGKDRLSAAGIGERRPISSTRMKTDGRSAGGQSEVRVN